MKSVLLALVAFSLTTPAMAHDRFEPRYERHHRHRDRGLEGAVIGGVLGIILGGVIASQDRRDRARDRYLDNDRPYCVEEQIVDPNGYRYHRRYCN